MPSKNSGKKKKIDLRRTKIATLYNRGVTNQHELSRRLDIPLSTINRDLANLAEEWRKSAAKDIDSAKTRILAKLSMAQEECADAWEKSKKKFKSTIKKTNSDGVETTTKVEDRTGDPRHMANFLGLIKQESAIYGIDAIKNSNNQPVNQESTLNNLDALPKAQQAERLREMLAIISDRLKNIESDANK